jgi:hypothetical protein
MNSDNEETDKTPNEFDFSRYPLNTLFHDRRNGRDRRRQQTTVTPTEECKNGASSPERRRKPERRRRIDPTTFEKQYTEDELEFMNAMQRFKERSGKTFPTHGDIIRVAIELGYRRAIVEPDSPAHSAALAFGNLE